MEPFKKQEDVICPRCNSLDVIPIVYGLPGPETIEKVNKGELFLGGCILAEDNPKLICKKCKQKWEKV